MSVCGSGRAAKGQVQQMVGTLLGLPEPPESDHAADALAVAICHASARAHGAGRGAGAPGGRQSDDRLGQGEVLVRRPDHVVVDSGGVGYRLTVSAETLKAVPARGKEAGLHAQLVARDDSLALYGFASEEERDLFLPPDLGLRRRAQGRDRDPLRRHAARAAAGDRRRRREALPGGARDRQAHLRAGDRRAAREGRRRARGGRARARRRRRRRPRALARDGLVHLGYTLTEAEKLLDGAEGETPEELIGAALRRAGGAAGGGGDERLAAIRTSPERRATTEPMAARRRWPRPASPAPTTSSTARCARGGSPTSSTRSR